MKKKLLHLYSYYVHSSYSKILKPKQYWHLEISLLLVIKPEPQRMAFFFITLKNIAAGTLIYFTEKGWGDDTWIPFNPEVHLLWTVPSFTFRKKELKTIVYI